ncbi:MAG: hypothetical protein E7184_00895 [Erysipelotrichaceae bacterium]|nr:hypothetical protein [Erysipelotrichaceae bacterium]
MSNTLLLTKVLIKGMFSFGSKKKGKFLGLFLAALLVVCFVPFAMQAKDLAIFLGETGSSLMIEMLVVMSTLVLMMISLMTNIGVVFFSKDNDILLHMPLKPREIFFARNIIVLISCYFLVLLLFLPSSIGIGIGLELGASFYIFTVIVSLLLPIIPCFLSSLITLLMVRFLKFIRNKDVLNYLTMIVALAVGIGFSIGMEYLMPVVDETTDVMALINNYKVFIGNLGWLFPYSIPLMKIANIATSLIYKLVYLFGIIGIGSFLVYLCCFLADKMYFSSLLKIAGFAGKKKKFDELKFKKKTSNSGVTKSLIKREFSVIFRTPMYLMNMVIPIVFPLSVLFVLIPITNELSADDLLTLSYFIKDYVLYGIFIIVFLCSFGNLSSPVMYSKDGNTNGSINYLPVSFMNCFLVKVFISTIFSIIPYAVLVVVSQLVLKFELLEIIFPICLGLLLSITMCFVGVFIDVNRPKIKWNNEAEAVKNNLNVFIYMIILLIYVLLAFILEIYTILLCIITIGFIIALVYKNESKYIDKLS